MKNKYKFPITECPKCGCEMFAVNQRISGIGAYYIDLKTGEIEASELHSGLQYRNINKYAVCANCGKRLFKIDNYLNIID